jgi:hypothetical protein
MSRVSPALKFASPAFRELVSDLQGDFSAQQVGRLVAVPVKLECRMGAGRRGLLKQHDAVAGLAAKQFQHSRAAGRHTQYRAATRQHTYLPS